MRVLLSTYGSRGDVEPMVGLAVALRALGAEARVCAPPDFTDLLALCQFLPGGNVINLSVAVGMKFRGVAGALAGLLGLIVGPSLIVIGLVFKPHVAHVKHKIDYMGAAFLAASLTCIILFTSQGGAAWPGSS